MKRFWEKVDKTSPEGCWLWTASTTNGYGRFRLRGKRASAHRVSYELANGVIPDGLLVLHKCDTPACVNPSHLFLGTQKDNVQDCANKGRRASRKGTDNPQAKLSPSIVTEIRTSDERGYIIAKRLCISKQQVSRIRRNQRWVA